MTQENEVPTGNITVSFCNQPYPAYLGGYQADMVTRTAMALNEPDSLKRNISNHLPIIENSPVIEQTVRHYNHAVLKLAAGQWEVAEGVALQRQEIGAMDVEPEVKAAMTNLTFINKQALCTIWGDAVVLVNDHYYWLSINKCDHTTSAQMILDAVRMTFTALKLGTPDALVKINGIPKADVDKVRGRMTQPHATTPPAPPATPPQTTPKPPVMAGGGTSKRIDTSHVANATGDALPKVVSTSDSGTPHFAAFPSTAALKTSFGASYGGQVVSFEMQKANRVFSQKDGSTEYELYAMTNHQYPAIKYIHADPQYIKDQATLDWLNSIQGETLGRWRVVCYVSVKGDKTYFNVNKVTPIIESVPDLDEPMNMEPAKPKGTPPATAQTTLPGTPEPKHEIPY